MHNFTHEYKQATKKVGGVKVSFLQYLGSRCSKQGCQEGRNRATLDQVKRHNDQTGAMFSRTSSRIVAN